ncbi:MAG: hypothetical protein QM662_08195 [Gordonia sp. (in: high G+C Gram-positive bacteria)]
MSLSALQASLRVVHDDECDEWAEVCDELDAIGDPVLFWYPSSGVDMRAIVHVNDRDTTRNYRTPPVDLFVYSDYGKSTLETVLDWYDRLDEGGVVLHQDRRTHVELVQAIPLAIASDEKMHEIWARYPGRGTTVRSGIGFHYLLVTVDSEYFGAQDFPILLAHMDNWALLAEVWRPHDIRFDYVAGVTDGCRKGGAYRCVNADHADFLPAMRPGRRFWIADHFPAGHPLHHAPAGFDNGRRIHGWGHYNRGTSYLFEVRDDPPGTG